MMVLFDLSELLTRGNQDHKVVDARVDVILHGVHATSSILHVEHVVSV